MTLPTRQTAGYCRGEGEVGRERLGKGREGSGGREDEVANVFEIKSR